VTTVVTENLAGTRVMMTVVDGYSMIEEALDTCESIESERFRAGGHSWYIKHRPGYNEDEEEEEEEEEEDDWLSVYLCLDHAGEDDVKVTARYE
jgi:speckle-type POZ protein